MRAVNNTHYSADACDSHSLQNWPSGAFLRIYHYNALKTEFKVAIHILILPLYRLTRPRKREYKIKTSRKSPDSNPEIKSGHIKVSHPWPQECMSWCGVVATECLALLATVTFSNKSTIQQCCDQTVFNFYYYSLLAFVQVYLFIYLSGMRPLHSSQDIFNRNTKYIISNDDIIHWHHYSALRAMIVIRNTFDKLNVSFTHIERPFSFQKKKILALSEHAWLL